MWMNAVVIILFSDMFVSPVVPRNFLIVIFEQQLYHILADG